MSDPIQAVPSAVPVPRVAPVRQEPPIEPAKKAQTESRASSDRRESERQAQAERDRQMSVTRDETLRTFVYRSIEQESGEVVWQWPAEEMLRLAKHMRELEDKRAEQRAVDERA
jgi:uncharacterized FlaG/YvyC family protein